MITLGPYVSYKKHDLAIQLVLVFTLAYEISGAPPFQTGDRLTQIVVIAIFLALLVLAGASALMGALHVLSQRTSPNVAADALMAAAMIYMGFIMDKGASDWRSLFTWLAWYGAGRGAFEVYGRIQKWLRKTRDRHNRRDD